MVNRMMMEGTLIVRGKMLSENTWKREDEKHFPLVRPVLEASLSCRVVSIIFIPQQYRVC